MQKTICELFAGVGGFRLGFDRLESGWETTWFSQWEPGARTQWAHDCYVQHFGDSPDLNNEFHTGEDICTVDKQTIPDHTLLVGGFPCQDYSVAHTLSSSHGIEGKKGVLWWQIRDTIIAKKPPFCIFENVDRLLRSPAKQRGRDFGVILACLAEEGYSVEWRVVNAAQYGAAQRRRRTFIFAYCNDTVYGNKMMDASAEDIIRNDGFMARAFPIVEMGKMTQTTLEDDIVNVSNSFEFTFENAGYMHNGNIYTAKVIEQEDAPVTLGQILQKNVDSKFYITTDKMPKWTYLKGAKKIPRKSANGHEYTFSEGPIAFPDPWDRPSRTMLTSESTLNRSTHVVSDPSTGRLRILTPIEAERLQGFDDEWTNSGMPDRMRYFCMGNALVVPMITRMGNILDKIIELETNTQNRVDNMSPAERHMKDVLRCPEKQNNYDATDIDSIFHYALGIEGKTLLTILQEAGLTEEEIAWVRSKESDKGLPGKIVEASYFGYELNSRQEADFETVGAELKTTAADYDDATSRYKSGETVSITQIDFRGPVETDFYASHLYNKLKMLIVIFYHRDKTLASKLLYKVFFASLFSPSEEDLAIIKSDYREIIRKISAGLAHTLSRSDGTYLSTAPKARRSTNMITPYYGGERIVKRSYTLRKEYVNVILNGYYSRPEVEERLITDIRELERMSFAQIIQSRFEQYTGWNNLDIAGALNHYAEHARDTLKLTNIPTRTMNKSTLPVITARMLGLRSLRSEEFTKAGIVVKTVFFNRHGTNKEKFRLSDVDFMEIYNAQVPHVEIEIDDEGNEEKVIRTGWEDSDLFAQLDSIKYLFVVFQEAANGDIIFKGSKMWAMSDEDIEKARLDWMDIKAVLTHGVQLSIGSDGRTYNNFPGVSEARCVHLRPHGAKAFYVNTDGTSWGNGCISDTEPLPDGRRMTRQSYWLNNSFVREIVRDLINIE